MGVLANLRHERDRLYQLIDETAARGVIILSGDRHAAGIYVRENVADYPIYEVTSSSLNLAFADALSEAGPYRIGEMYAPANYGAIEIDWQAGAIALEIRDEAGQPVRAHGLTLSEITRQ